MRGLTLHLKDNPEFLLDIDRTTAKLKSLFPQLTEQEIFVELISIQAWLEKSPQSKRWKERGVEAGLINWFKKYSNSSKFSRRETNGSKARGQYGSNGVRSLGGEYGSERDILTTENELKAKQLATEIEGIMTTKLIIVGVIKEEQPVLEGLHGEELINLVKSILADNKLEVDNLDFYLSTDWVNRIDELETEIEELVGVDKKLELLEGII